jgi:hypothetical protein
LTGKFAETVNVQVNQEDNLGVGSSHIFEIGQKLFDVIAALDRHENLAAHRFFLRMSISTAWLVPSRNFLSSCSTLSKYKKNLIAR